MEYALTAEHKRIYISDAEKTQDYFCPVCGGRVIPRQGQINAWHFAHESSCLDTWNYDMSDWHKSWQARYPAPMREVVVTSTNGERHRADILMGGYVIEFQHSPITGAEFEARNHFYTKAGYRVVWVFDVTEDYFNGSIEMLENDKYHWRNPIRAITSIIPQKSANIAILLQFEGENAFLDMDNDVLVKIEWARTPSPTPFSSGHFPPTAFSGVPGLVHHGDSKRVNAVIVLNLGEYVQRGPLSPFQSGQESVQRSDIFPGSHLCFARSCGSW